MAAAVGSSPMPSSPSSNKRKRALADQDHSRNKLQNTNGNDGASDYAFLHAIQDGLQNEGSAQTAQAALATSIPHSQYPDQFDPTSQLHSYEDAGNQAPAGYMGASAAEALQNVRHQHSPGKPSVGTQAWHQQRKDNHKEVERRRREVINEGIENISKIVPGSEKNKGAILARTHSYILELQNKIAGFDNERHVFDSTLQELTNRHDALKNEVQRAWAETQKWQQRCKDAGLSFDDYDATIDSATGNGVDDFGTGVDADVPT